MALCVVWPTPRPTDWLPANLPQYINTMLNIIKKKTNSHWWWMAWRSLLDYYATQYMCVYGNSKRLQHVDVSIWGDKISRFIRILIMFHSSLYYSPTVMMMLCVCCCKSNCSQLIFTVRVFSIDIWHCVTTLSCIAYCPWEAPMPYIKLCTMGWVVELCDVQVHHTYIAYWPVTLIAAPADHCFFFLCVYF